MTKEKKIIIGIISILTLIIVILSYFLINKNAIIEKQAEKIELQAMETNGSNSYVTTQEHLNETSQNIAKLIEFKREIASAITDMGVATSEDASAETMASNIRSISSSGEDIVILGNTELPQGEWKALFTADKDYSHIYVAGQSFDKFKKNGNACTPIVINNSTYSAIFELKDIKAGDKITASSGGAVGTHTCTAFTIIPFSSKDIVILGNTELPQNEWKALFTADKDYSHIYVAGQSFDKFKKNGNAYTPIIINNSTYSSIFELKDIKAGDKITAYSGGVGTHTCTAFTIV